MASVRKPSRRRPAEKKPAPSLPKRNRVALVIFCVLVVAGPLAFGAVDRVTQVVLLALFAAGLFIRPAVMLPLDRLANRIVIALLAVVVLKEFAPAAWFGGAHWRSVLVENFGLELPWTHNPEPALALDSLLALLAAALWFVWVRTLASDRECRPVLAWALVASGAVLTAVSYSTRGLDPQAIYGLRFTPGWTGFGPFPNRNHTADFLGMALVLGCGCTAWAAVRKHRSGVAAGLVLCGIILLGLLATQSRGGLLAAGVGAGCFIVLALVKFRSRRVLAVAIAGVLGAAAIAMLYGSDLIVRFQSKEAGQVSNVMRLQIWGDALRMWSDAPLFGHGLRTFPQTIGLYQTLRLEDQVILHPESSWLQWLVEFGAIPVLLGAAGLGLFLSTHVRAAFARERGFFLRAGALSAFAVLLVHSAIDVPAHRWGTLGFALAALAIGCPMRVPGHIPSGTPRVSLVPLVIALFWVLPFKFDWPGWSPLTLTRLIDRENRTNAVPLDEMQSALRYFPLHAPLHQAIGLRQVRLLGRRAPTIWQRHFGIAATLIPGSWPLIAMQARAVAGVTPGLAIGYWQQALERCDLHRDEVLGIGVRETAAYPMAPMLWGRYVEANPTLLLAYAKNIPDQQARYFYSVWWQTRALTAALTPGELEIFYRNAAHWGTRTQFDDWMRERADWKRRDYRLWASLLHQWGDQERAFELLAGQMREPEFQITQSRDSREALEMRLRNRPTDYVAAQSLALALRMNGETVQSDEIILAVAQREHAPPWFLMKGGYIYARMGRFGEGVALMLRAAK